MADSDKSLNESSKTSKNVNLTLPGVLSQPTQSFNGKSRQKDAGKMLSNLMNKNLKLNNQKNAKSNKKK